MESKKESKNNLTNETLTKDFKSNFELVNYAIKLAKNLIKAGQESRFSDNRAMSVLKEIEEGKDLFNLEYTAASSESRASQELDIDALEPDLLAEEQAYTRSSKYSFSDEE